MNPIYASDEQQLDFIGIGMEILRVARNELYLNMRFLDVALSSLQFVPDGQIRSIGTDGVHLYFHPDALADLFRTGRVRVARAYLHSLLHCLFGHLWIRKERDEQYWNLACDIAVEYVIDGLQLRAVHVPKTMLRREYYRKLKEAGGTVTAQKVYRELCLEHPQTMRFEQLVREFRVDDHSHWEEESQKNPNMPQPQKQRWDDIRDRMQTEIETFSKEAADDVRSLEEEIAAESRQRYDYREFLRKFCVLKEEMQVDLDSFDYIFYNYGMELYGNMPLIEPLETKEQQKIEDFVIVVDTSMSCKGELIKSFLEQTCAILQESESFFRRLHIHIIQCDDKVQEDVVIRSKKEFDDYMRHFTVRGFGGTDFRPAFAYVQDLLARKAFTRLRGLIYFTDGYGTFPVKKPPYETAFVFLKEDYRDVDVPPWAIKLILEEEDLERRQEDEY
ncbi:MAG: VWA-like domain-containing protein [Lachnospiraceae bacterium]|nr:VWA-like domain-containing protein [Lachnospiraceae bacterium]